jgi:hypothetical protein
MHRVGAWATALLLFALTGCFTAPSARPSNWLERVRTANRTLPPDGVLLEYAIVEQPLADPFVNLYLWADTTRVVDMDHNALLEDNGIRVGQVVGTLPGPLQGLLANDRCCYKRWRQLMASGTTKAVELGPTLARCQFTTRKDGTGTAVAFAQAQPYLELTPTLTEDGKATTVRFTPLLQHGDTVPDIQATRDLAGLSGWQLEYRRRQETYADLAWEVTLKPNEYVVVGAFIDDADSLGSQCFSQDDGPVRVQRLLVVRTTRALAGDDEDRGGAHDEAPPLALQAAWSGGTGP